MSELPPDLVARCQAITDNENQGEPLKSTDYVWFFVVTLLVPALIVVVGVML